MGKPPEKPAKPTDLSSFPDDDRVAHEIAKRLSNILPTQQRAQVVAQVVSLVQEERFSGPIAHPRHLREYEEILPGSANRIISMAEGHMKHAQGLQARALDADVDDMREGRRLGFAALMALIAGAIICGALGHEAIALALLGAGVIGVIGTVIKGRGNRLDIE